MSKNKKASFWRRLKYLIDKKVARDEASGVMDSEADTDTDTDQSDVSEVATQQTKQQQPLEPSTEQISQPEKRSQNRLGRIISLDSLGVSDSLQDKHHTEYSDNPITDSILAYLDANDLSYYYHDPAESDADNSDQQSNPQQATTPHSQDDEVIRNVHHISMAMRYHADKDNEQTLDETSSDSSASEQTSEVEWGCVIRIHEHTQLVAIYGVLPFHLPPSHLQAGLTLAAQLNYDMMLGCVEIDIRDGEIRFKNSLDFEPIIESHQGKIPAVVISYLLKGVMAMTASFAPIFKGLIDGDPQDFELFTTLDKHQQDQLDDTFFLASKTPQ